MVSSLSSTRRGKSLKDPEFNDKLQGLRQTDNFTNLFYLARTWLFIAAVIGGTIWALNAPETAHWSTLAKAALIFLAITAVGAGQHQLTGLAHEASHHILLKNRYLNDIVSDWFCLFPMFSCTHHYRLQHMAHHQFVNDPDRDPDVSQLKTSGHWLRLPMKKAAFVATLAKQLFPPRLIKYIRVRAQYNSVGTNKNPYLKKGFKPSKIAVLVGIGYMLGLIGTLTTLVWLGNPVLLLAVPAMMWAAAMAFYSTIPDRLFHQSRVHPVISNRVMTLQRITFITTLFTTIAWFSQTHGLWAPGYFVLLWLTPMFTSFSFFMILRQLVQHGNGDRGWLTNTRIFFVNPVINFCVFPMGQDYHLPHHMYASVPHYRLKELHQLLLEYAEYRDQAVVVQGYFLPKHHPPTHPTVLDVMAAPRSMKPATAVYIDNSVLEQDDVDDRAAILDEALPSNGALINDGHGLSNLAASANISPTPAVAT